MSEMTLKLVFAKRQDYNCLWHKNREESMKLLHGKLQIQLGQDVGTSYVCLSIKKISRELLRESKKLDQHVGPMPKMVPAHCLCSWQTQAATDPDSTFQHFPLRVSAAQAAHLAVIYDLQDILYGLLPGLTKHFTRSRVR